MMTLVHTLAVAEYLNFRHAANALGVAQSSVSARVKARNIGACRSKPAGVSLSDKLARDEVVELAGEAHHL